MGTADVTNVTVTCTTNGTTTHTISATVTGLWGTVVLTNTSNGDEVTVIRDASPRNWARRTVLATPVAERVHDVQVTTQPSGNRHDLHGLERTGTVAPPTGSVEVACTGRAAGAGDGDCPASSTAAARCPRFPVAARRSARIQMTIRPAR
jgi:hypothetical protein